MLRVLTEDDFPAMREAFDDPEVRDALFWDGEYVDATVMSILETEWAQERQPGRA